MTGVFVRPSFTKRPKIVLVVNVPDMWQSGRYARLDRAGALVEFPRMDFAGGGPYDEAKAARFGDVDEIRKAVRQGLEVKPDVVLFACTSGSYINGPQGDEDIRIAIAEAIGIAPGQVCTTSSCFISWILAYRALFQQDSPWAVASPYTESVTTEFRAYLANWGIETLEPAYAGAKKDIPLIDRHTRRKLILAADRPDAAGILFPCTNMTFDDGEIDSYQVERHKPVVYANGVGRWAVLGMLGLEGFADWHWGYGLDWPGNPPLPTRSARGG